MAKREGGILIGSCNIKGSFEMTSPLADFSGGMKTVTAAASGSLIELAIGVVVGFGGMTME